MAVAVAVAGLRQDQPGREMYFGCRFELLVVSVVSCTTLQTLRSLAISHSTIVVVV